MCIWIVKWNEKDEKEAHTNEGEIKNENQDRKNIWNVSWALIVLLGTKEKYGKRPSREQ